MDDILKGFSGKFRSHWIKVKFYGQKPEVNNVKRLKGVKFCEATREAILHPVLLDKESIACPGARHAFGWESLLANKHLQSCCDKRDVEEGVLKSMLSRIPFLKTPFKYIGLNTDGVPDLVMSYIQPQEVMNLLNIYHNKKGGNLDVSLCSMMAICGGIAVRTYLDKKISLSFGCNDSRKFADMRTDNIAVGIPREMFNIFID